MIDPDVAQNASTPEIGQKLRQKFETLLEAHRGTVEEMPDSVTLTYTPHETRQYSGSFNRTVYSNDLVAQLCSASGETVEFVSPVETECAPQDQPSYLAGEDLFLYHLKAAIHFLQNAVTFLGARYSPPAPQECPRYPKIRIAPAMLSKRALGSNIGGCTGDNIRHIRELIEAFDLVKDPLARLPHSMRLEIAPKDGSWKGENVMQLIIEDPQDFSQQTIEVNRVRVFEEVNDRVPDWEYLHPNARAFVWEGVQNALAWCETHCPDQLLPPEKEL